MLYLDNAATSRRKPPNVYKAMMRYGMLGGGNAGRGANKLSLGGVRIIIKAQERAAELFGIDNEANIVFTQNATYALNMAIMGSLGTGEHMIVNMMDHNSVLRPAVAHGNYSIAAADKDGFTAASEVRKRLRRNTALVVSTHISNVCGTYQPVREMARAARSVGAMFLLDASQSAGNTDISVDEIGADMMACPGHKGLMGPMGTGILYIRDPSRVRAVICGGTGSESENLSQPETMPDKFHSGTMNVPAIAGLAESLKFIIREGAEAIGAHERRLADMFRAAAANMSGVRLYGKPQSGIVAFNINGADSGEAERLLGDNIIVRSGYHCAPLAHKALGTYDGGAVRASFGYYNTVTDVKRLIDAVYAASKAA